LAGVAVVSGGFLTGAGVGVAGFCVGKLFLA